MPMRRRSTYNSWRRTVRMSCPATVMEPLSAVTWPVMRRSNVVLPVPLGPMTAVMRPRAISMSSPANTARPLIS